MAAIVLEHGGDEDLAVAGLLHDAVEDAGGNETLALIRSKFGDRVANVVNECSDTDEEPKPPWKQRKEAYLAHLAEASTDALLVSAADKLHNSRSILMDLATVGPKLWERFSGGREGTIWYYQSLVDSYGTSDRVPPALMHQIEHTVAAINELAQRDL